MAASYISKTAALKLKRLGFKECCDRFYVKENNTRESFTYDNELYDIDWNSCEDNKPNNHTTVICSCPTYHQAVEWCKKKKITMYMGKPLTLKPVK